MPFIRAHNISLYREYRLLFESVDLTIAAGDLWQIEGVNGSGKSSLMRMIAGLLEPSDVHQEQGVSDQKPCASIEREIDASQQIFIGHQAGLKEGLTPLANLSSLLAIYQAPFDKIKTLRILELLGLKQVLHETVAKLSAGQQRRVALARLWLQPAKLWILDEPFTSLDALTCVLLEDKITEHLAGGGAVLLSSHQEFKKISATKTLHLGVEAAANIAGAAS